MNKLLKFSAIALSGLMAMSANANWHNIHKVQYLMQNLDERDSIVYGYANYDLTAVIDFGNQIEDGVCLPWDMMGGVDFDSATVASTAEFSIDNDGDVKVDFYPFADGDQASFYVRFDDNDNIADLFDEDFNSFIENFNDCLSGL